MYSAGRVRQHKKVLAHWGAHTSQDTAIYVYMISQDTAILYRLNKITSEENQEPNLEWT